VFSGLVVDVEVEFGCVHIFCYLGDMIGAGGRVKLTSTMKVRYTWNKFSELLSILTTTGGSLKLKGSKIYTACV